MPRTVQKLSDTTVKSQRLKQGRHSDGGGLYLNVGPTGSKSWLFMWARDGKRREMGLGAYPDISLSKARLRAAEARQAVADGRDPIAERAKGTEPTFGECAAQFLASNEGSWKSKVHRGQWRQSLKNYCAAIEGMKVSAIETRDVLRVLQPIWGTKTETASRVRGRIERILDYAKAKGWRTGANPALWRGHLGSILPSRDKLQRRGHYAAMAYDDVAAFMAELRASEAMTARALEFLILTASRSGEVLGAKWSEIDLDAMVWTVPAPRMKSGREHRVPLTAAAVGIAQALHETRTSDHVFPGQRRNQTLSKTAMQMLMRRLGSNYTIHGFRSAFRDWCGDKTSFPRDIAEAALAHAVGDETERAYRRSDALAKRRKLMEAWDKYLSSMKSTNVLKFKVK